MYILSREPYLNELAQYLLIGTNIILAHNTPSVKVQSLCTPLGQTISFLENHSSSTISLYIGFKRAGYLYEPPGKEGLVSLVTKLLQAEIDQRTNGSFFNRFYYKSITIHCHGSVFDKEHFGIEIQSFPKQLSKALSLLAESLHEVQHHSAHFQQVLIGQKQVVKKLAEDKKQPETLAIRTLNQLLIGNKRSLLTVLGSLETLDNITSLDVGDYISKHFSQRKNQNVSLSNTIIDAAGHIHPVSLMQHIDTFFKRLPITVADGQQKTTKIIAGTTGKTHYIYRDIPQSVISFGQLWVAKTDSRYNHFKYLERQIEYLLHKRFTAAFGTTYQLTLTKHHTNLRTFLGTFSVEQVHIPKAIELIQDLFNVIKQKGVPIEELSESGQLTTIKQSYSQELLRFIENVKSDNNLAAFYVWNQQTHALQDLIDLEAQLLQFNTIQQKDIDQLAARLLDAEKFSWVEVGKENHIANVNT